jgi:hypothetical protein
LEIEPVPDVYQAVEKHGSAMEQGDLAGFVFELLLAQDLAWTLNPNCSTPVEQLSSTAKGFVKLYKVDTKAVIALAKANAKEAKGKPEKAGADLESPAKGMRWIENRIEGFTFGKSGICDNPAILRLEFEIPDFELTLFTARGKEGWLGGHELHCKAGTSTGGHKPVRDGGPHFEGPWEALEAEGREVYNWLLDRDKQHPAEAWLGDYVEEFASLAKDSKPRPDSRPRRSKAGKKGGKK